MFVEFYRWVEAKLIDLEKKWKRRRSIETGWKDQLSVMNSHRPCYSTTGAPGSHCKALRQQSAHGHSILHQHYLSSSHHLPLLDSSVAPVLCFTPHKGIFSVIVIRSSQHRFIKSCLTNPIGFYNETTTWMMRGEQWILWILWQGFWHCLTTPSRTNSGSVDWISRQWGGTAGPKGP